MPLLIDQPIRAEDWARETAYRDGHAFASAAMEEKDRVAGAWQAVVREIASYLHLGEDWDAYGADPPPREVLESAIGLAFCYCEEGVPPPHRVAPGVAGSVIFEWQDPDGGYATVEVDAPLHAEVMVVEPGKPAQQRTLPTE